MIRVRCQRVKIGWKIETSTDLAPRRASRSVAPGKTKVQVLDATDLGLGRSVLDLAACLLFDCELI